MNPYDVTPNLSAPQPVGLVDDELVRQVRRSGVAALTISIICMTFVALGVIVMAIVFASAQKKARSRSTSSPAAITMVAQGEVGLDSETAFDKYDTISSIISLILILGTLSFTFGFAISTGRLKRLRTFKQFHATCRTLRKMWIFVGLQSALGLVNLVVVIVLFRGQLSSF